jgi:shikimate kinase
MAHLKSMGPVVYLKLTYEELEHRLGDLTERGVALREGMSLRDLYEERVPLYEQYADVTVDEAGKSVGETMLAVFDALVDANLFTKE